MAVGGESPPKVSYVMTELEDMDGVFTPIKTASRVKYTCFDVSQHYIAFGTSAGGVIILKHDTLTYLKTLAVKEGPVCQAAFAPDDNVIGFSTSRGITLVMEHNADKGTTAPQRLQLSYDHKGSVVTALQWNVSSSKLFVADDRGKVSAINVTTSRTRNIFQVPTATLVKLDSKVVQLDYAQDHLLVSTLTRCYLCNTNREQFMQIGKKLRDGEYGACFYPGFRNNDPCSIYSARPGSRIWEVDIKGEVHCTHQFKTALAIQPEKVLTFRNELNMEDGTTDAKPHATAFNKMMLLWPSSEDMPFVFTWSEHAIYVFNPKKAEVVLWSEDLKGIKDVRCQRGDIYIHFQDGRFSKFSFLTVEHAVCRLYQHGLAVHGAQLLFLKQASLCASRLNIHVPASFLLDMLQRVSDLGKTYLFTSLSAVFGRLGLSPDKLSQSSRSSSAMSEPLKLGSGMYVINKLGRDADDSASMCLTRWRSASPVFRHMSGSPHSSPPRQGHIASPGQRKRSGTMPSVKLRDTRDKVTSVSSDLTPDSIDSGTSGKTSDFSDETHSSLSGRDMLGNLQTYVISDKANGDLAESHSLNEKKAVEVMNGSSSTVPSNSQKSRLTTRGSSSESSKKISLNLSDISKDGGFSGKKVSFDTKTSDKSSSKTQPLTNGDYDGVTDDNSRTYLSNGFSSAKNNGELEMGEEAICDMYPERFYEETYSYMNMSLYGMMVPNVDWSMLFKADKDFLTIKESLSSKLNTGRNLLKKGLEHLKQSQGFKPDLLDVKPKVVEGEVSAKPKTTEGEINAPEKAEKNFWSFLPLFDASELLEATKNARIKIRSTDVLFDTHNLTAVLEEWVNCLHAAQKAIIAIINSYWQSSLSTGSHSFREDDTIKSTCSQVTSTGSSPSENGEPSLRLETEEASISESKSYEDERLLESMSSLNTDASEPSTLKTESIQKMLSIEDFVFIHDPFRLQKDDHQKISELVMLCFLMKIWGNVCNLKNKIAMHRSKSDLQERNSQSEKGSNQELKSSELLTNGVAENVATNGSTGSQQGHLPRHYSTCDLSVPCSFPSSHLNSSCGAISSDNITASSHVSSLSFESFVRQMRDSDSSSVVFMQNYFHFVDIQRLREVLLVKNEPCMAIWNVILRGAAFYSSKDEFTQKVNSGQIDAAANCLERNYSGCVLVSHLLRLFRAKPSRTIELCLHRSYHVTPLDVLYLSKSCNMPGEFVNYVSSIIDSLPEIQRPKVIEKLLHLDEVRWEWLSSVLQDGKDSSLKCKCGWPKPGSHLHSWKNSELIFHIITTATNMFEKLVGLCFDCGFWTGYIWLSNKLNFCDNVKETIVLLGDASLLKNKDSSGYIPGDIDGWKQLFLLIQKQSNCCPESVCCISCGEEHSTRTTFNSPADDATLWEVSLNWESVSKAALSNLGPLEALSLLREVEIPSGALSSQFYSSIILSYVMEKQQSALSHRMLTNVGTYLWSRRPASFSPEVHNVFQKEKKESENTSKDSIDKDDICIAPKNYLEEPEGHWGYKFSLKGCCKLCKMPLMSHLSSSSSGIAAYPCGHVYHTSCLPEGSCIACLRTEE